MGCRRHSGCYRFGCLWTLEVHGAPEEIKLTNRVYPIHSHETFRMPSTSTIRALLLVLGVCLGAYGIVILVAVLKSPSWRQGGFMTGLFFASSVFLRKGLSRSA